MTKPSRWLRPLAWLGLLALVVALVGWRTSVWEPPRDGAPGDTPSKAGYTTGLTTYSPADRIVAPPLEGQTLDGGTLSIADFRGHVVVLNVWGSWCGPCRAEAPDLARAARQTASDGVKFVGIDTRDTDEAARAFVRSFKIPYPSIIDRDGAKLLPFSDVIPLSAVPSTIVVDRDGRIAATIVGRIDYTTLIGLVRDEVGDGIAGARSGGQESP